MNIKRDVKNIMFENMVFLGIYQYKLYCLKKN